MNKKTYLLLLPFLIFFIAGCVQKKPAVAPKPVQPVTQEAKPALPTLNTNQPPLQQGDQTVLEQQLLTTYGKYGPQTIPADWTAYKNNTFGFSLKHPSDWAEVKIDASKAPTPPNPNTPLIMISNYDKLVQTNDPKNFHVHGISVMVLKGQNPNKLSTGDYFKQDIYTTKAPAEFKDKMNYVPFAVINGIDLYFQKTNPPTMPTVFFTHGTDLYMIAGGILFLQDELAPVGQFDTILSSLKFE